MKHSVRLALAMTILAAGCDSLAPTTVEVELVNSGSFPVAAKLYIAQDQEIPEFLLTSVGEELEYSIPPGETVTLVRDCPEIQAVIVDEADLQLLGSAFSQTAGSEILRDGTDYGCGDRIRFTFTHSVLGTSFRVTPTIEENTGLSIEEDLLSSLGDGS
jgi:hypothetical protein